MVINLFAKEDEYQKKFYLELDEKLFKQAIELFSGRSDKRTIEKKKSQKDKIEYVLSKDILHKTFIQNLINILKIDVVNDIEGIKKLYSENSTSALLCFFYLATKETKWKNENYTKLFEIINSGKELKENKEDDIQRRDNKSMNNEKITYIGLIDNWNSFNNFTPKYIYDNTNRTIVKYESFEKDFPPQGKIMLDKINNQLEKQTIDKNYFAISFSEQDIEDYDRSDKITKKIDVTNIDILTLNDLKIFRVVQNTPDNSETRELDSQLYITPTNYLNSEKVIVRYKYDIGKYIYLPPTQVYRREQDDMYYVKSDIKQSKYSETSYSLDIINEAKIDIFDYESDHIHRKNIYVFEDELVTNEYSNMEVKDILEALVKSISPAYIVDGKISVNDMVQAINENNVGMFSSNNIPTSVIEKRKDDLLNYLYSLEDKGTFIDETISVISEIIAKSNDGKFNDNKIVEDLIREIAKSHTLLRKIREYSFVEEEIEELNQESKKTKEEIEELKKEQDILKEENQKISEEQKREAQAQYEKEQEETTQKLEKLKSELGVYENLDKVKKSFNDIDNKAKEAENDYNTFSRKKEKLKQDHAKLEQKFKEDKIKYENQLDDVIYKKVMSQRVNEVTFRTKREEEENDYKKMVDILSSLDVNSDESLNFGEYIVGCVQKVRNYEKDDIINIFACMYTGFITVFSGKPGTGKTSICNIIAKTLGLDLFQELVDNEKNIYLNRFVPISVERGWSTKRDFLGYFNPLTKEFDKNNKHLFDALSIQNYEIQANKEIYPIAILLDEANLSPMEYYWGDFMKIADKDNKVSDGLNLGNDYIYKISKNLRFLATINNDHTTETLSPRLLDRAWVVELPESTGFDVETDYRIINDKHHIISWSIIDAFFKEQADEEINPYIKPVYQNVLREFERNNILISRRSKMLIEKYIKNTQNIFREKSLISLDYALLQKVIPSIVGNGLAFAENLQNLSDYCDKIELVKTAKALNEIIKKGKNNMNYFNFFS